MQLHAGVVDVRADGRGRQRLASWCPSARLLFLISESSLKSVPGFWMCIFCFSKRGRTLFSFGHPDDLCDPFPFR